jgi:hypothetical protein
MFLFPGATKGGGECFAFPDVCNTPSPAGPVPVPYPNTGMLNQAAKTARKVLFVNKPVVTLASEIPRSVGDEAGVNGGVVSGTNMDKVLFKKGSSKVFVEGQPCVHLTSVTGHNGANSNMPAGQVVAPSQTKVLVAP